MLKQLLPNKRNPLVFRPSQSTGRAVRSHRSHPLRSAADSSLSELPPAFSRSRRSPSTFNLCFPILGRSFCCPVRTVLGTFPHVSTRSVVASANAPARKSRLSIRLIYGPLVLRRIASPALKSQTMSTNFLVRSFRAISAHSGGVKKSNRIQFTRRRRT